MAEIEIRQISGDVEQRELSRLNPVSIGRHATNDVVVDEEGVATLHCRISWNKVAFEVTSATAEGVDVNGRLVRNAALMPGDVVRVGTVDIALLDEAQKSQTAAVQTLDEKEPGFRLGRPIDSEAELKPTSDDDLPAWYRAPAVDFVETNDKPAPGKQTEHAPDQRSKQEPRQKKDFPKSPLEDRPGKGKKRKRRRRDGDQDDEGLEDWWEEAGDDEVSDDLDNVDEDDVAQKPSSRDEKSTRLGDLKARLREPRVRPGERRLSRSPLVLFTSIGLGVLVLSSTTLWFLMTRDNINRHFDSAIARMEEGRYAEAEALLREFIELYPRHPRSIDARLALGRVQIEKEIAGSTPRWDNGLKALDQFIRTQRDLPQFAEEEDRLRSYARDIAIGSARYAGRSRSREPLEWSNEALAILMRLSPPNDPPVETRDEVLQTVEAAKDDILKHEVFEESISQMRDAIAEQKTVAALKSRTVLLDRYPEFSTSTGLESKLKDALSAEKQLVVAEALDRPALLEDRVSIAGSPLTLAANSGSIVNEKSDGRTVYCVAKDCCFGIDAMTGDPLWRRVIGLDTPFFPIPLQSSRAGFLMFDSVHNDLVYIEQRSGSLLWRQALGEVVSGRPLVEQGQLYVPTRERHLYKVDLASGQIASRLTFPRPVLAPVALDPAGNEMAVATDEAVLYRLGTRPLQCLSVYNLDHRAGSIRAPLLSARDLLFIAENDQLTKCRLRVFRTGKDSSPFVEETSVRLNGVVTDPLSLRGRQLIVPINGERLHAFSVSDDPNQRTLTDIASYPVQSPYKGAIYITQGEDDLFWMSGSSVRKFRVTTKSIEADPREVTVGLSAQPLETMGGRLFLGRQPLYMQGVNFTQVSRDDLTTRWRMFLGAAPLITISTGGDHLVTVTEAGSIFSITEADVANPTFKTRVDAELDLPSALGTPLRSVELPDGRIAIHSGLPEPKLWIIGRSGQIDTEIALDGPLQAGPILLETGLVLPLAGRLKLHSFKKSTTVAEDYLAPLRQDPPFRWVQLARVDDSHLILADSDNRLVRLEFRTDPIPHLAEVATQRLQSPFDIPFVLDDDRLILCDATGHIDVFNVTDFERIAGQALPAAPSNIVWPNGNQIFVETNRKQLHCLEFNQGELKSRWAAPLDGVGLAGTPLQTNGAVKLILRDGALITLNSESGETIQRVELNQPMSTGLISLGAHHVAATADGSFYRLDALMEAD